MTSHRLFRTSFGLFWAHLVAWFLLEMPAGIGGFVLVSMNLRFNQRPLSIQNVREYPALYITGSIHRMTSPYCLNGRCFQRQPTKDSIQGTHVYGYCVSCVLPWLLKQLFRLESFS